MTDSAWPLSAGTQAVGVGEGGGSTTPWKNNVIMCRCAYFTVIGSCFCFNMRLLYTKYTTENFTLYNNVHTHTDK